MKFPNAVIVLADQMNARWMGCAGNEDVLTTNLDRFAEGAVRFDSAYCQNPICTPNRVDRDGTVGRSDFLDGLARDGLLADEDTWHNPGGYSERSITQDAAPSRLPYARTMERWSVDRALRFIDHPDDKPFFLQVNFQKPHHPLLPQREFWDLYPEAELPESFQHEPTQRPPRSRNHFGRTLQH